MVDNSKHPTKTITLIIFPVFLGTNCCVKLLRNFIQDLRFIIWCPLSEARLKASCFPLLGVFAFRILPHTLNWNNVNFLLTCRPFCNVVLSQLILSHFKFIFLHPTLTFFSQFRLYEMFGVNWQVLGQWEFWKFCKYIIRSEIIYKCDFKVERTRRVSSIWNQKYDLDKNFTIQSSITTRWLLWPTLPFILLVSLNN